MITREQIRELARFEDSGASALSFYFQHTTPRNKAHKEESIATKDLVRDALRKVASKSGNRAAREDLDRIVGLSQDWRSNGVRAKAIFACSARGFWREYDLPAQLSDTHLFVDRHFHLKPIARVLGAFPTLGVVLVDRHRARVFDLRLGELIEREDLFHPLPRRGRSDGFGGYEAGHAERRVADEARQHFKHVAERLKDAVEKGVFEKWIVGCQDVHWSQLEPQLHPYVAQRLIGRFSAEVAHMSAADIRGHADRIFQDFQRKRCQELASEAISQARSHGRGVTGLRRVLQALETGEVQTLLIGDNYVAQAVECSGCGHLDAHLVNFCPVCGRETREIVDVAEAILPRAINQDIEVFYVRDNPEFDRVGNIAAVLRYRVERNNVQSITAASANSMAPRRSRVASRYRGAATG